MSNPKAQVPTEEITRAILVLGGHRVLLDSELASPYGATTKRFNEQVRRNRKRFPADFIVPAYCRGQHRKYLPYVFTEHGAIMAATILDSTRAVEMSVYIERVRAAARDVRLENGRGPKAE